MHKSTIVIPTGPVRSSDAKLRRAQSLALSNGTALRIARELIRRKLAGQEQVARYKLLDSSTADTIARFTGDLRQADSISTIRLIDLIPGTVRFLMGPSTRLQGH